MFLVLKGVYSFSVSFIHLLMVKLSLNNWVKESYVIDTILFG